MSEKIQAVRGMNDLLPDQTPQWHKVEAVLRDVALRYGYREIRTPILEKTSLFRQSIGDATDIVEKEMYVFDDAGDVSVALRPEATASTVRAGNQHGLFYNQQQRLWYMGPMFRREKPQKGRYRQFHQFGVEAFGWPGPDIDGEVIRVAARIWKELGVQNVSLQLNTLGSPETRSRFRDALRDYFTDHENELDDDSVRRLARNPLRILDSKVPTTIALFDDAPSILDYLDDQARNDFDRLCDDLALADIDVQVNPRLVRGLDYYTSTVFEWITDRLGSQSAVCAGGRYDGLVEQRGGRSTPGVGWAMGIERLVELLTLESGLAEPAPLDVYAISLLDDYSILPIAESLRDAGLRVCEHCGGGKVQKRLKRADASGARFAIIVGEQERTDHVVQVKDLRGSGEQQQVSIDKLPAHLKNLCND